MDTLELERANEGGGSGSSRQYNRVQSGEHGGEFASTNTAGSSSGRAPLSPGGTYKPRAKKGGGSGSSQPGLPASSKFKTLGPGEDNDPQSVAEMQQLLSALGLGNLEANGQYDGATEDAVKEAQKRLGMKPTGKANKGLVNKLLNAYDLSPCVKRAEDFDPEDIERRQPYPGQKYKHGWIPVTVASPADDERAQQIRDMEQHVEKLRREGPPRYERSPQKFIETETQARVHSLPIGAPIPYGPDKLGFESLPSGHWRDRKTGRLIGESGSPVGWPEDLAAAEERLAQLKDPSLRRPIGDDAGDAIWELKQAAARLRRRSSIHHYPRDGERVRRVRRSEEPDPSDLIRSDPLCEFTVSRSEDLMFDTLRSAVAEPDEDEVEPVARAYTNPREPEPEADEPPAREIMRYDRRWELDDIEIVRGGSGREVTAYAAIFDTPAEIKDQHGHYVEVISRSAFNRAISHGTDRVGFYYHHGMTLAGTPSDLGSVPIGSPVEIRADNKGLRTVSRFNKSALADSVLEAIRAGDIKGYSFRGRIFQSTPNRVPRSRSGDLPTITRTELGLTEYGPTPTPYYAGAGIVAIRSAQQVAEALAHLDEHARHELLRIIRTSGYPAPTPSDPDADYYATPSQGPGAEDSPAQALRSAEELLALQATAAEILTRSRKL